MSEQPAGEPQRDTVKELQQELREMGKQLETAFRVAVESDRAKRLQADIEAGVREISSQVQSALEHAQHDPRLQEAEERGRQVINQARESKVVSEMQELLVTGISQINGQLRKLIERIEQEAKAPTTTQHVPVEHDPQTGETTKLDS